MKVKYKNNDKGKLDKRESEKNKNPSLQLRKKDQIDTNTKFLKKNNFFYPSENNQKFQLLTTSKKDIYTFPIITDFSSLSDNYLRAISAYKKGLFSKKKLFNKNNIISFDSFAEKLEKLSQLLKNKDFQFSNKDIIEREKNISKSLFELSIKNEIGKIILEHFEKFALENNEYEYRIKDWLYTIEKQDELYEKIKKTSKTEIIGSIEYHSLIKNLNQILKQKFWISEDLRSDQIVKIIKSIEDANELKEIIQKLINLGNHFMVFLRRKNTMNSQKIFQNRKNTRNIDLLGRSNKMDLLRVKKKIIEILEKKPQKYMDQYFLNAVSSTFVKEDDTIDVFFKKLRPLYDQVIIKLEEEELKKVSPLYLDYIEKLHNYKKNVIAKVEEEIQIFSSENTVQQDQYILLLTDPLFKKKFVFKHNDKLTKLLKNKKELIQKEFQRHSKTINEYNKKQLPMNIVLNEIKNISGTDFVNKIKKNINNLENELDQIDFENYPTMLNYNTKKTNSEKLFFDTHFEEIFKVKKRFMEYKLLVVKLHTGQKGEVIPNISQNYTKIGKELFGGLVQSYKRGRYDFECLPEGNSQSYGKEKVNINNVNTKNKKKRFEDNYKKSIMTANYKPENYFNHLIQYTSSIYHNTYQESLNKLKSKVHTALTSQSTYDFQKTPLRIHLLPAEKQLSQVYLYFRLFIFNETLLKSQRFFDERVKHIIKLSMNKIIEPKSYLRSVEIGFLKESKSISEKNSVNFNEESGQSFSDFSESSLPLNQNDKKIEERPDIKDTKSQNQKKIRNNPYSQFDFSKSISKGKNGANDINKKTRKLVRKMINFAKNPNVMLDASVKNAFKIDYIKDALEKEIKNFIRKTLVILQNEIKSFLSDLLQNELKNEELRKISFFFTGISRRESIKQSKLGGFKYTSKFRSSFKNKEKILIEVLLNLLQKNHNLEDIIEQIFLEIEFPDVFEIKKTYDFLGVRCLHSCQNCQSFCVNRKRHINEHIYYHVPNLFFNLKGNEKMTFCLCENKESFEFGDGKSKKTKKKLYYIKIFFTTKI